MQRIGGPAHQELVDRVTLQIAVAQLIGHHVLARVRRELEHYLIAVVRHPVYVFRGPFTVGINGPADPAILRVVALRNNPGWIGFITRIALAELIAVELVLVQ